MTLIREFIVHACECGRHYIDLSEKIVNTPNNAYNCEDCGVTLVYTDRNCNLYLGGAPINRRNAK